MAKSLRVAMAALIAAAAFAAASATIPTTTAPPKDASVHILWNKSMPDFEFAPFRMGYLRSSDTVLAGLDVMTPSGNASTTLLALKGRTGEQLWTAALYSPANGDESIPLVDSSDLYIAIVNAQGAVELLDAAGHTQWVVTPPRAITPTAISVSHHAKADDVVVAVQSSDPFSTNPNGAVIVLNRDGVVYSVSIASPSGVVISTATNALFVANSGANSLVKLNLTDGKVLWNASIGGGYNLIGGVTLSRHGVHPRGEYVAVMTGAGGALVLGETGLVIGNVTLGANIVPNSCTVGAAATMYIEAMDMNFEAKKQPIQGGRRVGGGRRGRTAAAGARRSRNAYPEILSAYSTNSLLWTYDYGSTMGAVTFDYSLNRVAFIESDRFAVLDALTGNVVAQLTELQDYNEAASISVGPRGLYYFIGGLHYQQLFSIIAGQTKV